jgi:hypothetical protein
MDSIVVIGGGWAGCSAAITARQLGVSVVLLERTDMLLGCGLAGGIMRNNGRWTATEEAIAMGGGTIFEIVDNTCKHKDITFPGQEHVSLYDVHEIEHEIGSYLTHLGVDVRLQSRVTDVVLKGQDMEMSVVNDAETVKGDVFVETTGSAGPVTICNSYGNGCAMCVLRCHTFGGRVSVAQKAGIKEVNALGPKSSSGALSGSVMVSKDSIARDLVGKLNEKGVVAVKIPEELRITGQFEAKACPQYGSKELMDNLIVLDNGHAKIMVPFFPLGSLRKIPGFEKATFIDPLGGGRGNSTRYASISPTSPTMKVNDINNLFCGGEKVGPIAGHTEAIVTGILAGYNAARLCKGEAPLSLPKDLSIGDFISFVGEEIVTEEGLKKRFTFSGSVYFDRMKKLDSYTTDRDSVRKRVKKSGCEGLFLNL